MNRSILANVAGRFWSTLSNLIFLPLYVAVLGIDGFAVISFSLIVAGVLVILDLGLTATISREMARSDVSNAGRYRAFKTFETLYVVLLLLCGFGGLFLAGPVADYFIHETPISRDVIALCLKIIIFEAAMQLGFRFYISAMMGLDRQVEANVLTIIWGMLRNGLVVLVIMGFPSLTIFFSWQLAISVAMLVAAKMRLEGALALWRPSHTPRLDWRELERVGHFTGGVFLIALVAVVNTQLDRIVLSSILDLRYLGYYTIAVSIGAGMLALSSPFQAAIQPRLTRWFSEQRLEPAKTLYLRVSTIVAILIFPFAAVIGWNAEVVIFTWMGDAMIARNAAPLVPLVVTAYAFLAMQTLSYAVALANGFTRYHNIVGLLTLCISVPGYWIGVHRFGAVGAAAIFALLQVAAATIFHALIDRRFLRLGVLKSYVQMFVVPAVVACSVAWGLTELVPAPAESRLLMLLYLAVSYALTSSAAAAAVSTAFRIRWRLSDLSASP